MNNQADLALLFPGSGSQYKGMMRSLYESSRIVQDTLHEADEILGFELSRMMMLGSTVKLNRIGHMLPAICAASVAHYRLYREQGGPLPAYMAGHSLGEYSALICSGALSFKDGLLLVSYRARLAEEVMEATGGAMSIMKSVDPVRVASLCLELQAEGRKVSIACLNSRSQIAVSGQDAALAALEQRVAEASAHAQISYLIGSAPYHCALMQPRAAEMAEELSKYSWSLPACQLLSNVTGRPYTSIQEMQVLLPQQLYKPVLWQDSILHLLENGAQTFIEMGPQNILKTLMPEISDETRVYAHDEKVDRMTIRDLFPAASVSSVLRPKAAPGPSAADSRLKAIAMCLTHAMTTRNYNQADASDMPSLQLYTQVKQLKQELDQGGVPLGEEHVAQALSMLQAVFEDKRTPDNERQLRWQQIKEKTGVEQQVEVTAMARRETE
ncbi:ACP S-malonyltransferase [Paenibacillus albidus]|uniref:ACP S-malonyltransferase n=1 Tax=Paenibacillus albidus TaxID=2041023 RepID=UPI001BE60B19|nr:ACP S-malonyltransferase [Paenibacillus albidus]MBT2291735.1 ACP S-malonyltransferase [Paenibacillus albidus]